MNPFRWDVLLAGFVLALPVLALGLRGDFTVDEVVVRLPWCLAAGWAAVAVLRLATTPPKPAPTRPARRVPTPGPAPVAEDDPAA